MAPIAVSPEREAVKPVLESLASVTTAYDDTLRFYLNGTKVTLDDIDPEVTLLEYLRGIGLTGTKLGCAEGGCGACTVVVSQYNPTTKKIYHASVNACLAPLVSVDGKHIITIEGIGNVKSPHPAQERIAKGNGSQCGFCTPGIVMSLYALLRNDNNPSEHDIEEAFDGNLCRCTGYRPILDAAQTFSAEKARAMAPAGGCCMENGDRKAGGCCMDNGVSKTEGNSAENGNSKLESGNEHIENGTNPIENGNGPVENGVSESGGSFTGNGGSKSGGCCMENGDGKSGGCCKGNGFKDDQPIKRFTPPGFIEYNPDTELIFPPALRKHEFKPLALGNKRKKWYRPTTLQQLLEIKSVCPTAKTIGGSSETQIEIKFKAMQYKISVFVGDVAELRQFSFNEDHLEIGGNITLTDLEHIALQAVDHYGPVKGQIFAAINKQLKYFAGRQIRNVGTPAGNLATASPIADLNPVFVAANATLVAKTLEKDIEIPMTEFFKGYRRTALPPDGIIASVRIPVTNSKGEFFQAYKQSKRKDDDIAIVNAAFRIALDDSHVVKDACLVFGGMAPTTVAAKNAVEYIIGKTLTDPATLEGTMNALEKDFDLQFSVPGGMATYRKSLALGFFYRFYHEVLSKLEVKKEDVDEDVIAEIERMIAFGKEDHDATITYQQNILGKANPHVAALKQTTGEAQYTDDIPVQKNELYGCLVLSTNAHAKILSVDSSPAMDLPGVVRYVDHTDMPSPKANWWGAPNCDELFFAVDEVFTTGQPIGVVLADSALHASAGARAVKVEYEVLPSILTIEEAIEKESFFEHSQYIQNGDMEEAFKNSDYVFTGSTRMGGQEHFYLETQACVAVPKPEDGEIEIFASTQNPTETQAYVAQVCDVAENKVVSRVKRLGGGFGGKETRSIQLTGIVALSAKLTGRPVRCMLNRDEDMMTSGQRHPFLSFWKVGVNKDGKLQALDADVYCNAGWTQDLSAAVSDRALSHIDGCYKIPNVHVRGKVCKTNTMSNTAFRGFGGPQGLFVAESYMEEISDRLGIPAEKLKEINMYKSKEKTHFKQELKDWHVPIMYKQVLEESSYFERRDAVTKFNETHKWRKRGLAIVPTKFGISFTALFLNQAGALIHIYHDGTVLVAHGGTEMGQGLHTKMTMIAAEALGVPLSDVHISETATNTVANTSSTAASASSDLNGYAIFNACAQINERLAPYREKFGKDAPMSKLAHAAYFDRVNLSANGFYKTPDIGYVWRKNTGQMFYYFTQGVAAAEVEVDTLTGDWTCLRADIKMDIGRSINPSIDYGQIEGAFVQGMGLFTMEESLWFRGGPMQGQLATRGPGAYKIPGFRDVPQEFNVSMLKGAKWENLQTIQRSRGVGEPPLFMGSVVFFAIRDALKAARKQYGVEAEIGTDSKDDGLLRLESPATPERIRTSCVDPIVKRAFVTPKEGEKSFFVAI